MKTETMQRSGYSAATAALLATYGTELSLRKLFEPGHDLRIAAALAVAVAVGVFLFVQVRAIRRLDELLRQIHLEALAVGFPCALLLAFAVGHLRAEGLLATMDPRDLPVLLLVPYAIGFIRAKNRYQ